MNRTRHRRALVLTALGVTLTGCGVIPTFHGEADAVAAPAADQVLLVGRIDLVPALRPDEQTLRVGSIDPFDTEGKLRQRAILFLDDQRPPERRQTGHVMNPRLGEWFVVAVPRTQRFVADAAVFMSYEPQMLGRRQARVNSAQLLLPALFELDIRPGDQALYIGSWRVWRDEFHQVTRLQVGQDLAAARAVLDRRTGGRVTLRTALPAVAATGAAALTR
jgi:hypothetical protein